MNNRDGTKLCFPVCIWLYSIAVPIALAVQLSRRPWSYAGGHNGRRSTLSGRFAVSTVHSAHRAHPEHPACTRDARVLPACLSLGLFRRRHCSPTYLHLHRSMPRPRPTTPRSRPTDPPSRLQTSFLLSAARTRAALFPVSPNHTIDVCASINSPQAPHGTFGSFPGGGRKWFRAASLPSSCSSASSRKRTRRGLKTAK
jgi:hypothetical protein